ncbi:hypothetical protein TraAM80_07783 [Trypanosoma rangeli]|uniref:Coat protein n=1 Tax=Trypanosoma rangeli TaxID=5698 RepID=A0A3R7KRX2_TRYRA|nr:uncharacterized protein TraAM80_07783 [Trypanosoma rangeli]RNF00142.1 hypothetical protein TraAM80_07783 [Trypanosoma rangeli]|eukprot:RNF00142.1 hypothetical protein TraAM80_07783 [Trypanosoma rangeli]
MQRPRGGLLGNGGGGAGAKRPRKHISFARDGIKVRFVKPPPRSMNHRYWFTETESVAKKGISFEVEPDIAVSVDVSCRMQLTGVASQSCKALPLLSTNTVAGKQKPNSKSNGRVYLRLKANPSLGALGAVQRASRWLTVASVEEGHIEKIRVILPVGSYTLSCVGPRPVQVFAQVWDLETRLN